ncbi:SDR family NAD(P)-dependent oxidoreductase [Candidatus Nephthysia bennettiae]|uniref:SDR family NAD(P)-dependent oxidoreductase n=1 Tax=Candidatus Nephthysia bennettiae TaxID=3127016 RepID=A0A934N967_9BACT|nr:SDR family NAD(P)-dependent oxidoreductase [Candidatus Dormibacteraeota bacterium]MBJ7614901.1 SDR family NAD(P)-dependent oxidoreductase [Candidatus Dormibacteraeota bacterium]
MRIEGVSALVTGGGSGLGRATVEMLAERGASVVVFDLPGSPGAEGLGEGVRYVPGDVRSEEDVQGAVEAAGELRVLVNCAGIGSGARIVGRDGPFPLDHFRRVLDVNLVGTFNALRLAAAQMSRLEPVHGERGVVINTASIAAFEGQVGQAAYAASKAGIVGLTICAARDLAGVQVRVCTIAPGTFDTPLLSGLDDQFRESLAAAIPHPRRLGQPREYARLACDIVENPMLNGETIRLDGALRMAPR